MKLIDKATKKNKEFAIGYDIILPKNKNSNFLCQVLLTYPDATRRIIWITSVPKKDQYGNKVTEETKKIAHEAREASIKKVCNELSEGLEVQFLDDLQKLKNVNQKNTPKATI